MSTPSVSIIMPVFNMEPFLKDSIESILHQDYGDYEFLIINDGSTDGSESVVKSFSDKRIRYLSNPKNYGLVYTLNRGIEESRGKWIARMDGDDISLPERLSKQMVFVKENPDTDILATRISLINEDGSPIGEWQDDVKAITEKEIKSYLIHNNCIAHPTILARKSIMDTYLYNEAQSEAEDYDLWLRMASDGIKIRKLNETLLLHRIRNNSFTRKRQKNVFMKLYRVKSRFVINRFKKGKINVFVILTGITSMIDFIKAIFKYIRKG